MGTEKYLVVTKGCGFTQPLVRLVPEREEEKCLVVKECGKDSKKS